MQYKDFENQLAIFVEAGYYNPASQSWYNPATSDYSMQFDTISAAKTYYNNLETCPPETKALGNIAIVADSNKTYDPLLSLHYKWNNSDTRGLAFLHFELIDNTKDGSFTLLPNAEGFLYLAIGDLNTQEFNPVMSSTTITITKDGTKDFYLLGYLNPDYDSSELYTPAQLTNLVNLRFKTPTATSSESKVLHKFSYVVNISSTPAVLKVYAKNDAIEKCSLDADKYVDTDLNKVVYTVTYANGSTATIDYWSYDENEELVVYQNLNCTLGERIQSW